MSLLISMAGVFAGGGAVSAFAGPVPVRPEPNSVHRIQAVVCEMRGADTPYYERDGTEHRAGRGQRFDLIYEYPNGWRNGNMWGGLTDVHIWGAYMFRVDDPSRSC